MTLPVRGERGIRLRNRLVHARRRLGLDLRPTGDVAWLFVATLPNSGSTALSALLDSAPRAVRLHRRGEGQWLVPELVAPGTRWNPDAAVDLAHVRAVWLDRVLAEGGGTGGRRLVVEKSPPNLCRFRALVAAFADMPVHVVRFTRDPYAICASWARRYGPAKVARDWDAPLRAASASREEFCRLLGDICGRRMAMLADLGDLGGIDVAYEALAADPAAGLARLVAAVPDLAGADPDAVVAVKDYAPQGFRDMNAEQIAGLAPGELVAITEGLRPHAAAVAALGYALREPEFRVAASGYPSEGTGAAAAAGSARRSRTSAARGRGLPAAAAARAAS
jgi:hypothetical protein